MELNFRITFSENIWWKIKIKQNQIYKYLYTYNYLLKQIEILRTVKFIFILLWDRWASHEIKNDELRSELEAAHWSHSPR